MRKSLPGNFFFGGTRKKSKGEQEFELRLKCSGLAKKYRIEKQYHLFGYKLDFAFFDIKLDVEIDGMQHYTNPEVIEKDKKREIVLLDAGWTIYRIASKDFLARTNVVFGLFERFLEGKKTHCRMFRYDGQIIDGDAEWVRKREEEILNSGIVFGEIGWTKVLGTQLGVHSATARRWVMNNMPKFYKEECRTPKKDYLERT